MNDTFKEIEESLDTTNKSLTLYQDKINRLEAAQRRVESYLLHFQGYYGNTHMQFKSLEEMTCGSRVCHFVCGIISIIMLWIR